MIEPMEAADADQTAIRALLHRAGLPTMDLTKSRPHFVVIRDNADVVAAAGLQIFGAVALVRSVVVADRRRGAGLGGAVIKELEAAARVARVERLYLLTQTARGFFLNLGYQVIERSRAPAEIQGSEEFRSLCPASATCMMKRLA